MSSINLVDLIVEAEQTFETGIMKKQWVLNKLQSTGLNQELAGVLIDDVVKLCNSQKLFGDSDSTYKKWCCLK